MREIDVQGQIAQLRPVESNTSALDGFGIRVYPDERKASRATSHAIERYFRMRYAEGPK